MSSPTLATAAGNAAPKVSFEFFPPKNEKMEQSLWDSVRRLEPMAPHFVSVTYGAGGSTRERTHDTVRRLVQETALTPAAHLTCVDASKSDVLSVAKDYWAAGVRHIVALRGDPPTGVGERFQPHPEGFADSVELIRALRAQGGEMGAGFEISVSCYPEPHPESQGEEADLAFLKAKQEAGADRAITQFFFEPEHFLRFRDRAEKAGIHMPLVPGVMLQSNFKGLQKFAGMCGAHLPDWLYTLYEGLEDDPETRDLVTAKVAADLCGRLADEGVDQFHFYTLNRAGLALSTCHLLGLKPETVEAA